MQRFNEYVENLSRQYDGTEYWTYECPHCGGKALNGDPEKGIKFRGGAKCRDCGQTFSAIGRTPLMRGWEPN